MSKAAKTLPSPEELLLDYAERLTHHRAGRRALTVALSRLAPPIRPDDHWRVVENLIQPLTLRHGGEVFRLSNGDVAVVFTSLDKPMTDRLVHKLRYLFRDDPAIAAEERGASTAPFAQAFDIHTEYDAFIALARAIHHGHTHSRAAAEAIETLTAEDLKEALPGNPGEGAEPGAIPLIQWFETPPQPGSGLHRIATRMPVVRLAAGAPAATAFEYLQPHPDAFTVLGLPLADLERNEEFAAAARALTARRLLLELPAHFKSDQPLALALELDALLSPEFLNFHHSWALGRWLPVTACLSYEATLGARDTMRYVRTMIRELGHRIALGPLPMDIYQQRGMATPAKLGADILIFTFDQRYTQAEASAEIKGLRAWLAETPGIDVMLTGAESREAIRFGQGFGASLFVGRQASHLVGRG